MYTVSEAAARLDVSRQRVHYLIRTRRLRAKRHGFVWMVTSLRVDPGKTKNGRPKKLRDV
jgi:excisionase family DNA binding protein